MQLTWEQGQESFLIASLITGDGGDSRWRSGFQRGSVGAESKAAGSMAFVNKYTLGAAISRSLPDVRVQKLLQRMACGRAQWRTGGLMW